MILGPLAKSLPQLLFDCSTDNPVSVESVQHFKLLGITLSHDINWQAHIDAIITKASSRLYFLKILKKSGLQSYQLRHFYLSVIRPILEYCSPIWHHGLTKAQAESLEAIQHRTLRIIDSSTVNVRKLRCKAPEIFTPYEAALSLTQFTSLHDRREHLNKNFFTSITIPSSCISRLLPPLRDSSITSRLRTPSLYPRPATRTKRYTSFIHHTIKLPVKHTLTLPPKYLKIHSFIVILLFSLHLFYGYALCNLAIQATETNKCDLIWFWLIPTIQIKLKSNLLISSSK